jgi:DNA-binding SARP family transcriptional activator
MSDGRTFTETGVIHPGWVLQVPLPSSALEAVDGEAWYTVERGDTLWGIAGRFLDEPTQWPAIYALNRDTAALVDGRTLGNPNLIWPGLRLRLPLAVELDSPTADSESPAPAGVSEAPAAETRPQIASTPATTAFETAVAADPRPMQAGAASAALAAAALGIMAVRRGGRRSLLEPPVGDEPETDVAVRGGFAELNGLSRRLGQEDLIHRLAEDVLRLARERNLEGGVGILSASSGRSGATLTLVSQRLADRPLVQQLGPALAARLGVAVDAQLSRDHDVVLRMGHLRSSGAFPLPSTPHRLVPVGVLPNRRMLWLNWRALGHVLVAGDAEASVRNIVTGLVASLAARVSPHALRVVTIARPSALPPGLARLPHQATAPVDPADEAATAATLQSVRAELVRRMQQAERAGSAVHQPDLVLVVPELESISVEASTLDLIGTYGPSYAVRLVAGTAFALRLPESVLGSFQTRFGLRLADVEASERVLGCRDAVDLLGGGQMLVRLDERHPFEIYGCRVSGPELDLLVAALGGATAGQASTQVDLLDDTDLDSPSAAPVLSMRFTDVGRVPVDVRCFGGFEVSSEGFDLVEPRSPAEAADNARAWELLAFLAAQPEGVAERDVVSGALWPSSADENGAALVRTLDRLNALLARAGVGSNAMVVLNDDGSCRLDLTSIQSDVHRFTRLVRAAALMLPAEAIPALQRARELYRGDLLVGPGARAYAWIDAPVDDDQLSLRARYREHFYRATVRLGRLLAQEGQVAEATSLFRELLTAEPLLEDVVRELYRTYGDADDVDGLLSEERRLRVALRQARAGTGDDDDPEPATMALFASIRQDIEVRQAVPA